MVMVRPIAGMSYGMDGYLKSNLDIIKYQINTKDNDFVGVIDGFEGVGKSVLAQQIGKYVDPTLDLSRICFTAEEFKEAVLKAKKGQCVIYDEAITGAFSREAIQMMNVVLIKMMAQIRQQNLFCIFVLPSFFDLDKNLSIWRSKFLIHCHYGKKYDRGYFKFANLEKKKTIYIEGQKLYKYPADPHKWNFWGRFSNHYTVDEKQYRAKKLKGLTEADYETVSIRKVRAQRDSFIIVLSNLGYSQDDISELSNLFDEGITQKQISNILTKYQKSEAGNNTYILKSVMEKGGAKSEGKPCKKKQNSLK